MDQKEETTDATEAAAPVADGDKNNADPQAKLFVGNLSWGTDDQALRGAFESFGTVVSAEVVKDRATGRSKGFGFVQMSSAEEANAAAEAMNGKDMDGRPLTVNIARPKSESSDRGDRGGYNSFNR